MKTIIPAINTLLSMPSVTLLLRMYMMPLLFPLITLISCNNDDEDFTADVARITGTYAVTDTFENGDVENYSITISDSKDGGVEISNFGDIMYVPVKATIKGNIFNVPPQTFKGKSMTIIISGNGTLNGEQLTFDYTIDTGDDQLLEHSCVASKGL